MFGSATLFAECVFEVAFDDDCAPQHFNSTERVFIYDDTIPMEILLWASNDTRPDAVWKRFPSLKLYCMHSSNMKSKSYVEQHHKHTHTHNFNGTNVNCHKLFIVGIPSFPHTHTHTHCI